MLSAKQTRSVPWKYVAIATSLAAPLLTTHANAVGFADDFSQDSIRYAIGRFDNSSPNYSVDYINGAVRVSSAGTESATGNVNVYTQATTDFFEATVSLSSESSLIEQDEFSSSVVFIEGFIYNDSRETSLNDVNVGDIWATVNAGVDQYGNTQAGYCLSRTSDTGQATTMGDEFCGQFDESTNNILLDTQYDMSIRLDRAAKEVTLRVGDYTKQFSLSGDVFEPIYKQQRIQFSQNGAPGLVVGNIHRVGTDTFSDDFSQIEPIFDRYRNFRNDATSSVEHRVGQLVMSARSSADDGNGNTIAVNSDEGYIEVELKLLDESTIGSNDGKTDAFIQYTLYNDTADNGFDGRTGDVRAQLYASQRGDGRKFIEYCLRRSDDADNNQRTNLLPDGRSCENFPLLFEKEQTYRVSIELDRSVPVVRFRVDAHVVEVPISGELFAAADPYLEVGVDSWDDSYAIAEFDNLRTLPNEPTQSEIANGLVQAPAFPTPVDPASIQVDSTIAHPFDFLDYTPRLDFVDDFTGITTELGFSTGEDRGQAGVSWRDGALVLENNSFEGNDDGNWSEFYINQPTDSLEAVVSLSSESRTPPDDDAEASIQIRAVFYNDTQDYGFNDQEGDMEAVLQIRIRGDGRRSVDVSLRRRDQDGRTTDDILNDIDEVRDGLAAILPVFDQQYRIGVALDRENSVVRYTVDDTIYEYAIPTGIFKQARLRTLVSVNHRGSSGVAVGRVHSIKTDTLDEDFTLMAPVLAPYNPTWNAQSPGRSVTVVDGRLRLEADGSLFSGRDAGIEAIGASNFVGAQIELSSESDVQPEGRVHVEVHSIFYNDLEGGEIEGSSEGRVFSAVRLVDVADERYVEYCAWRSNDSEFNDATLLVGDDPENCPRFTIQPELDVAYEAFVKIDRTAAQLTFGFADENFVYNIPAAIGTANPFNGVKARTSDNSKVVAWADDLSFSQSALPLADSASALTGSDLNPVSGGSGCSITSRGAFDPILPILATFSMLFMGLRRRQS